MNWLGCVLPAIALSSLVACDGGQTASPGHPAPGPGEITVNLHNLCDQERTYVLGGSGGERTLAPGEKTQLNVPPGQKVELVSQGATVAGHIETHGGHIWFGSSCTDIGTSEDPGAYPPALDAELRDDREAPAS